MPRNNEEVYRTAVAMLHDAHKFVESLGSMVEAIREACEIPDGEVVDEFREYRIPSQRESKET